MSDQVPYPVIQMRFLPYSTSILQKYKIIMRYVPHVSLHIYTAQNRPRELAVLNAELLACPDFHRLSPPAAFAGSGAKWVANQVTTKRQPAELVLVTTKKSLDGFKIVFSALTP
jgi:hypothetical protein